ncbi:MAG: hypothetical protein ABSD62_12130 [Candidatus Limnocylindrales bacterium]|jgi:hypothetical protein
MADALTPERMAYIKTMLATVDPEYLCQSELLREVERENAALFAGRGDHFPLLLRIDGVWREGYPEWIGPDTKPEDVIWRLAPVNRDLDHG